LARTAARLRHFLTAAAILLGSALPAGAQTQTPAPAKPEVEHIQDWSLQCTPAQGDKPRTCFLIHDVFRTENNQRILQVVVGRFGADSVLGALFFVPLGIRLPPGLVLKIDQNEPQTLPLERCTTKGCQAQILLADPLLSAFKAGNGGELTFEDASGQAVAIAFSLNGFTAGLGKLP
jgi:invasion protein IalB